MPRTAKLSNPHSAKSESRFTPVTARAERLMADGVISNGMIPKIRSAFTALKAGVNKVHLIDGRIKHSILIEIFTDLGIGTELVNNAAGAAVRA